MSYNAILQSVYVDIYLDYSPTHKKILPRYAGAGGLEAAMPAPWKTGLQSNRYSFVDNYIDIYIPNEGDNLSKVTYLALRINSDSQERVYYFVTNWDYIPNGVRFYISKDNWATYINKAEILVKNIRASNKFCGVRGVARVLPCANTKQYNMITETTALTYPTSTICIYAQIQIVEVKVREEVLNIHTYRFTFDKKLAGTYVATMIRNIYAYTTSSTGTAENKASVLNIWLGTTQWSTSAQITNYFKTYNLNGEAQTITGTEVKNVYYSQSIIITPIGCGANARPIKTAPINIILTSPTGHLGVGSLYDKLELPNLATQDEVTIKIWLGDDGLKIVIDNDGSGRDITDSFKITNITNSNKTTQERIASALSTMSKVAGGVAQFATGSPTGIISGASGIASAINDFIPNNNGQYVTGGDGLTLWDLINPNSRNTPLFYISIFVSSNTSGVSAEPYFRTQHDIFYNGAEMSGGADSLKNIIETYLAKPDNYLCKGVNFNLIDNEAYIQADVEVSNVCIEAQQEIAAAFSQGIYVIMPEVNVE